MDNILKTNVGNGSAKISVSFKKVVNTKQYESETLEATAEIELGPGVSSAEREIAQATLTAQVEYVALCELVFKWQLSQDRLEARKAELKNYVEAIRAKLGTDG